MDKARALPPGRVRVALRPIGKDSVIAREVLTILSEIRAAQKARGHVPRTREEIDAAIAAMRGEDEDRMQAMESLHAECQRRWQADPGAEQ